MFLSGLPNSNLEIVQFKVLTTTWTQNSKSFILCIKFYGAPTGQFLA